MAMSAACDGGKSDWTTLPAWRVLKAFQGAMHARE